ncbi:hypothetical protein [Chitinophaga sp. YR627]|uniref:hypothetical protein n=1 Tax=Chitinophaga sp. YR627 TaxID=1881041 RepID=UPI0011603367|nr:hypothetical protein [Chitinophaga sp. YR627]
MKSTLQKNNIPVILSAEEGRHFANGSVIALVENQEKKLLQDVIISVNEDSIKCLPAMEMYNEKIGKIHRVKVGFENGMSSEWISIPNGQQCIALTVLNNDDISNYFILDNQRFRWKGKYLIPQQ